MPSYIAKGISSLLKGNTKTAENSLSAASRSNTRPFLKDNPDITTNTIVPNDSNYIENLTDVEQKYRLSKKEFDNQAPFGQAVQSFRNMFTDDIIQDQAKKNQTSMQNVLLKGNLKFLQQIKRS